MIEPDPVYAGLLREYRPGDVVVEAAASDTDGTVLLNRFEDTGLSTISTHFAALANERGFVTAEQREVQAFALHSVLRKHQIDEVHFLSIDVEGWELQVLRGSGLHELRPWIVCVEAIVPGTNQYCGDEAKEFVQAAGYSLALFDGINDWFVAEEHSQLASDVRIGLSPVDRGIHGWRTYETVLFEQATFNLETQAALNAEVTSRMATELSDAVEGMTRATKESERTTAAFASELASLNDRRALLEVARLVAPHEPADFAPAVEQSSPPIAHPAPAPTTPSSGAARRILRQAAKKVIPKPVVDSVRARRALSRFVRTYTAPSFLAGPRRPSEATTLFVEEDSFPCELLDFRQLSESALPLVHAYLDRHPHDSDASLDARLDRAGDQVGALLSDIRTSVSLTALVPGEGSALGTEVLFDARALQTPAYRDRGIGVFARSLLTAVRKAKANRRLVLFVDPFDAPLDSELTKGTELISSLASIDVSRFGLFVQPSPMTHDVAPLLPILRSGARSAAVIYDFIPGQYPDVYLTTVAARLRYATQLRSLEAYDEFLPISAAVETTLHEWVPSSRGHSSPSWPAALAETHVATPGESTRSRQVIVFGADEPRKNTLAALAGLARVNQSRQRPLEIIILGLAGREDVARHWAELAGLEQDHVTIAPRVSEEKKTELLKGAALVLVPSFAEGLSLPVIEALNACAPIVASDIDVHRELLGPGAHLADPARAEKWASAIRRALKHPAELSQQGAARFRSHNIERHEIVVQDLLSRTSRRSLPGLGDASVEGSLKRSIAMGPSARTYIAAGARLSIGVVTPWPNQRSGVADYSWATLTELANLADVTVYTTSDASRTGPIRLLGLSEAYSTHHAHDAFISVLGNSSFHLPAMQLAERIGGLMLCHDSRMVEYYVALEGETRTSHLMGISDHSVKGGPTLETQIDRGKYENLAFRHIADFSSAMIFHSRAAAERVRAETGGSVGYVPFVPLRQADPDEDVRNLRKRARSRLNFLDDVVHIASLGGVDPRMKLHGHVLEAAIWARSWGLKLHLHFVGSASPAMMSEMNERSRESGDDWFHVTGYVDDDVMRQYLSAADLLVQLRSGSVAMMSGPVADAAAFGTPTLASSVLLEDDALPSFFSAVADEVSPLRLAEQIAELTSTAADPVALEQGRRDYLASRNPERYAHDLIARIEAFR